MKALDKLNKFYLVLFSVTLIISVFLFNLPLTDVLGYEYSAIFAIILSLFGGLFIISEKRKNPETEVVGLLAKSIIGYSILFFLPLLLAVGKSIIFPKCPFYEGILFYFVIALPALFLGVSLGALSVSLSKRLGYFIFIAAWLVALLLPVLEIYFYPQIYFYNSIIGFFPGTIYDEDISIDHKLIAYRLLVIAFSVFLLGLSSVRIKDKNIPNISKILFVLAVMAGFTEVKPSLGFATNLKSMVSKLGAQVETEHFIITYPVSFGKEQADFLAYVHEYYYDNLKTEFGIDSKTRINSFIFRDGVQKGLLFGANRADVAKPWLNQIYLNSDDVIITLQHELAHVLAGQFGTTPFKIAHNFNPALIEGMAAAMDDNFDGYEIHQITKMASEAGYRVNISQLFSGFNFMGHFSSVAYQYAGSFMKFLSDKYGFSKTKEVYANGDFEKSYGKSIDSLAVEYSGFLDSVKVDFNKNTAQLYYAGMPIFKKYCPRLAANETKKAGRLFAGKNYGEALEKYSWIYEYSSSYSALAGKINSLVKLKRVEEAETFLGQELYKFNKSQYFYNLELILGDLFTRGGKLTEAGKLYRNVYDQRPSINYAAAASYRIKSLSWGDDSVLVKYLDGTATEKFDLLWKLNSGRILPETISPLLNFAPEEKAAKEKVIQYFRDNLKVTDRFSANAAYELSLFALSTLDLNSAKYFAVQSVVYDELPDFRINYVKNLKMINWIINFSGEVKNRMIYK